MLAQQIEEKLPRSLPVAEPPAPGQKPVRLRFEVTNPTAGVLWLRFRTAPFLFKVEPNPVSLKPGLSETVAVEIDSGKVTRENYKNFRVIAAWSVVEKNEATGQASTRNGEHAIVVDFPPPRRLLACPDPECANPILSGATKCERCGALLRTCPVCEMPALRTGDACSSILQHPIPRAPDWPQAGGAATRAGVVAHIFRPQAALAWKYAPPSPKPSAAIEWSAPAVAYDMVFLAGSVPGEWSRLVALDLASGGPLWEAPLPENDPVYPYRAAPAVARGSVYVATHGGYLVAIDALRGRRRWAARLPHHLYAGCLAAGNALFVGTVHREDEGGHVLALWPEDGEVVWKAALPARLDTLLAAKKGRVYACSDGGTLYALNAKDGSIAWEQPSEAQFDGGPVIDGDVVYCANTKGELMAFRAAAGEPLWKESLPAAAEAAPAVQGGRVYCGCADGTLTSYSVEGKRIGSAAVGAQMRAAPVPTTNGVLLGAEDGSLYFSDALRQVSPLYPTETGTRITAPLAVSGRRVLFSATNGAVYAVDVEAEE